MAGRGSLDEAEAVPPDPRVFVFSPHACGRQGGVAPGGLIRCTLTPTAASRARGDLGWRLHTSCCVLAPRIAPSIGLVPCAYGGSELAR
jgi:hypothetical protein